MRRLSLPRPPLSPLRRELRNFAASVVALHVVALIVYASAGIRSRSQSVQTTFGGVWTALTVLLVVRGLLRVRAARRAGPGGGYRRAGPG